MLLNIPENPKVLTTKYENFKGVDFTNDPSNVWYRRSPDAVNMLPDEAGRPFKRTGWEVAISAAQLAQKYYSDGATATGEIKPTEATIRKCYYFEMAGYDHIVIFTNFGVFFYRDGELLSSEDILETKTETGELSYNKSVIDSYYRAFFFEGGGERAFYIYGDFKVWKYYYGKHDKEDTGADQFYFRQVETYIPRVNIAVDAKHVSGEPFEDVNLFSDFVSEEYQDNEYKSIDRSQDHEPRTSISGASVIVDDIAFTSFASAEGTYTFTYTEADHSWLLSGDQVYISNYGITLANVNAIPDAATITVEMLKEHRINLGRTVTDITGMKVFVSRNTQFDTELTIIAGGTPTSSQCKLSTDTGGSYLTFAQSELPLVSGEDCIKVIFPRSLAAATQRSIESRGLTATAT